MNPEDLFAAIVEALRGRPGVSHVASPTQSKRPFGSRGELKTGGSIFAFLSKGKLVVKLPRRRVDALVESGEGERYDPGHGRLMKEWATIAPSSGDGWLALASEALEFVGSRR